MSSLPRKDPTLDRVHLELVENNNRAASVIPPEVERLEQAARKANQEARLVRYETKRVRTSRPGLQRPVLKK